MFHCLLCDYQTSVPEGVFAHAQSFQHVVRSPFEGTPRSWWSTVYRSPDMTWTNCVFCHFATAYSVKLRLHRQIAHGLPQ